MLKKIVIFFLFGMFSFNSYSKVCEISIVKSFKDLKEKIKICDIGDKLYLNYDIKLIGEELVVNLCSLKDTIIFKEGMIVSNEPGYYKNGEFGIRIENLIRVKKTKNELRTFDGKIASA